MNLFKNVSTLVMILNISVNVSSFAQPSDKKADLINISDVPTANELNEEFLQVTKGRHDSYEVMSKIVSKKDKSVDALDKFLFAQIQLKKSIDTINTVEPHKQYALYSLMGIASPKAIQVLYKAALTHPDKEVRALALNIFSWNMYYKAQNDTASPDKEILHLIINSADDVTYIQGMRKRIGEIAREGIKNWTGEDYGTLTLEHAMVRADEKSPEIPIEAYRENWWQKNYNKISWNRATNHFELNTQK